MPFLYGGGAPTVPMEGADLTDCGVYICQSAAVGSDIYLERPPGVGAGTLVEASTLGFVNVAGLYYTRAENTFAPGDFTYRVTDGFHGTNLGEVTVTWTAPTSGASCPIWPATPPPVLTAAWGVGGIHLNWTASVSADTNFWSIQYDLERTDVGVLAYLHDTLSYVDTTVTEGFEYTYRVRGHEPVIGGGSYSNAVTVTWPPDGGGGPAVTVKSWGMIAK